MPLDAILRPRPGRQRLRRHAARRSPAAANATVDGVFVQQLVRGGLEVIVGVSRDRLFGRLVMFGLGGVYVEALRDVVFRVAPITALDAGDMRTSAQPVTNHGLQSV